MGLDAISAESLVSAVFIGNESLLIQCATIWLDKGGEISAIITDSPEVTSWARDADLLVISSDLNLKEELSQFTFQWLLSIANLNIISHDVLNLPMSGAVNFHDGPLPRYAGLNAPVWARMAQESHHGVTWHMIEAAADTGDILVQRMFDMSEDDTAHTLNAKCYALAIDSFPEVMQAMSDTASVRRAQDFSRRSYFARSNLPDGAGQLDFHRNAQDVIAMVRALDHGSYYNPVTTPKITASNRILIVKNADFAENIQCEKPGTIIDLSEDFMTISCDQGAIILSGISNLDGMPEAPEHFFQLGEIVPTVSQEVAKKLTLELGKAKKNEPFWRQNLARFIPATLPLIAPFRASPEMRQLTLRLPNTDIGVTALAILALRSGAPQECDIAFRTANASQAVEYLNDWVPLRIDSALLQVSVVAAKEKLQTDIITCTNHGGFARDLIARDPNLGPLNMPEIGVSLDPSHGPIIGPALSFELHGCEATLHFDRSRVRTEHAERLMARLRLLITSMDNQKNVASLPFFPSTERHEVLERWNSTTLKFDPDYSIHAQFEAQVSKTPDAPALVFEQTTLTYSELNARANSAASVLSEMGVDRGTLVGLFTHRSPNMVVGALAILKAGGAYVPLDPAYPAERLKHYIADSDCNTIVTTAALAPSLPPNDAQILDLDTDTRLISARKDNPKFTSEGGDLAYLIYTSGSTGLPKGVMVEHSNVANFFAGMDARITRTSHDTWLAVTSLSFDISVLELFWTLSRGFKLVLAGDDNSTQIPNRHPDRTPGGIEFSIFFWGNDDSQGSQKYEMLLEGAKFADENGFCAVWTPERHFHAFGGPYPNAAVTGAAVAAVTKQISVRAGSCVAPLHHTARIAEEWAVIDNLTNGRAGLALASGWQPDDFVLRPENTPPRNRDVMFQQLDDLRKLWRGEPVEFPRNDGSLHSVITQPRPISPELPVWVTTAGNPETWKDAGRRGCNVLSHLLGQSIEDLAKKISIYHKALRQAGYDPADFKVTLMLHCFIAGDRETARETARGPMKAYLRSAVGLIKQFAWAFPAFKRPTQLKNASELDLGTLSDDEIEQILDYAFMRYFDESGLFGTIEDALDRVEQVKRVGVSEIACLVDYGIKPETVLQGLRPLAEVLSRSNTAAKLDHPSSSISAQILRHNVSHIQCTPSMARMLVINDEAHAALANVKHLLIGGEPLSGSLVAKLRTVTSAKVQNMYGPTETTIWSSTVIADASEDVINIGSPIANTQFYVLDHSRQPVPIGVAGELFIGGAGVARGYWRRNDMTSNRFVTNPFGDGRLYRTGDLVRWRDDAKLDFLGRADHQIKLRGYRIELGEIESRLERIDGINQAVVTTYEYSPGDVRLVAYLQGSSLPQEVFILNNLRNALPDYMQPKHFVTLAEFPLTPNKKIDRASLPAPEASHKLPLIEADAIIVDDIWRTKHPLYQLVVDVWSRVLGVREVSTTDNFFDLGGHSLLAVQSHNEIKTKAGAPDLSIVDIFRFPVLRDFVSRLEELNRSKKQNMPDKKIATDEITDRATFRARVMSKRREMRAQQRADTK